MLKMAPGPMATVLIPIGTARGSERFSPAAKPALLGLVNMAQFFQERYFGSTDNIVLSTVDAGCPTAMKSPQEDLRTLLPGIQLFSDR